MMIDFDYAALVANFETVRILVIGDICLDRFVRGDVSRISSEAPIPVIVAKHEQRMLGQAGNSFANLVGLKVAASIISVIGDDQDGRTIIDLVAESGADTNNLIINSQTTSTVKTRYMSAHQQVFRVDTESLKSYPAEIENLIVERIEALLPQQQAVILSDYGYGLLGSRIIRLVVETANRYSIPVLVDPRGKNLSGYSGATVATPNRKELSEATGGIPTDTDHMVIVAAKQLIQDSGIQNIVATRSQDGMSIIGKNYDPVHLRTAAQEVFDVSGAGDTVIATIAAGLASGASLVQSSILANIAAGIVVGKVGTSPIRTRELLDALQKKDASLLSNSSFTKNHCLDWEEAREQVEKWRARGLKIGFTNGCFDIIHAGHVNYLNGARKKCDRLILGLNNDKSIRLLKGSSRPVNDESSRATVLNSLGSVSMVVLFGATSENEDNTAGPLLKHLKPDVYFKGSDYTLDQLPEAKIVMGFGGKVEFVNLTEGLSTTKTIEKMKATIG